MEIRCKKTPTTGIQIFVDGEYLTSFSYHPECDELIELLENAQKYKDACGGETNNEAEALPMLGVTGSTVNLVEC